MTDLAGRVVLISGGSAGLGAALAAAFAAEGARVSLCARGGEGAERVAAAVRAGGGECAAHEADVTDAQAVAQWVAQTRARWGAPYLLVNNASLLGPRVPLLDYPADAWRRVLDVNLTGALAATQAVLPAMLAAGAGVVLNVSSGAAVPPRADWGAYAVSKAALEAMTTNLSKELEGSNIRVHAVDPGAMRTGMRAAAYPAEDPADVKPPREAARVFVWLAGMPDGVVSGERFRADEFLARGR